MKKLVLFIVFIALAFGVLALNNTLNDATDFVLLGIAAFLLAVVAFVLAMAVLNIYRFIRYRHGDEIREDGYLYHGPLNSVLIPWDRIDKMEIKMVSVTRVFGSGRGMVLSRSKTKVPAFFIHRADKNEDMEMYDKDMLKWISELQKHLRAKSPRYTQHDIDWVERWRAVNEPFELPKRQRTRARKSKVKAVPPDPEERLDAQRDSGMSEKQVEPESFTILNEKE